MKYIELKTVGVDAADLQARLKDGKITGKEAEQELRDNGASLDYRHVIIDITKAVPIGIDFAEMRKHMRIIDATEAAIGVLALEDKDHELLAKLVSAHKWTMADKNILAFCEDVVNAPSEDPTALAEAAE